MINLDSLESIKKLDKSGVYGSIKMLPEQIAQAWKEVCELNVPNECRICRNVVISGMGGSALGGRIVDSLLADRVRTPVEVFTEFHLPAYVDKNTLVILSSYSGNTEETLSAGREALNRGANIFCITTGGKLADFMKANNLCGYIYDPKANPSCQPRMGLGYSITSILAVLAHCEFINLSDDEMRAVVLTVQKLAGEYDISVKAEANIAKMVAGKLVGKIPVIVASEHLVGAAHAFKNQLNENAKTFAALFDLPELNHHLMEGLRNPALAKSFLHFLFLESDLYASEVRKRYFLTRDVVGKNEVASSEFKLTSPKKLDQIFEMLVLGSFVAFYLSMLYEQDPAPIPWVDYFKEKMAND